MQPIPLPEIEAAANRIAGSALRTPLLRLPVDDAPAEIYLKLENLQPIGSFKLRGAGNAMARGIGRAVGGRRRHRERGQYGARRGLERAADWALPVTWSCLIMRRKPN